LATIIARFRSVSWKRATRWGFTADPTEGACSAPPDSLSVFRGSTSKGRERKGKGEEEREGTGGSSSFAIGKKVKVVPYSITERRVPELIPVLCSQPAGDVNHKPGGRLLLLSARPAVAPATLKRAATNVAAW